MEKENMIEIENVSMKFNLGIEKGFSLNSGLLIWENIKRK